MTSREARALFTKRMDCIFRRCDKTPEPWCTLIAFGLFLAAALFTPFGDLTEN